MDFLGSYALENSWQSILLLNSNYQGIIVEYSANSLDWSAVSSRFYIRPFWIYAGKTVYGLERWSDPKDETELFTFGNVPLEITNNSVSFGVDIAKFTRWYPQQYEPIWTVNLYSV